MYIDTVRMDTVGSMYTNAVDIDTAEYVPRYTRYSTNRHCQVCIQIQ